MTYPPIARNRAFGQGLGWGRKTALWAVVGLLVAVCAGGLIADVSAQTPAHSIDSVSPRSVGPISVQVVVTVSNVPGTTPAYHFRYRADGDTGAWTSGGTQSTSDTTFTRTITSTSFTDGSAWDFEVDVVSTFDALRTAGTHTHAATTLYVLNTLDDVLWEIDDISDVSGNDTNLGAVTGNAANAFGMVEFDGWMWVVTTGRELLRTRTPGTLNSWTSFGTLPEMEGSVRDIYADDTHIYILLQEAAYRIGNLTSSPLTASKMQATFSGHFRRGGAWVDDHYYTVSAGGGQTRICDGANAVDVLSNCSSAVTGISHPRAATEFNGRLLVWEQDDHQLYEILSPMTFNPTALSLGTADSSLADDVNAIASWSGNPATIVSGVATTGSITQTATIRVTLTAADSDGQTIYLRHRVNGGSTWTETNASATGLTHDFSLSGLTFSTTYQVQASMDYNFPPDDRASTTFTTPAPAPTAPDAPTGLSSTPGNGQVVLSWTPPAANGSDIIRYGYSSDDGSTWRTTGSAATSYTATQISAGSGTNLQNGKQYTFRVRAVNGIGTGTQSGSQTATPFGPPGVPTTLTAVPGDQQVVLGWNAAAANGSDIIRYGYSSDDGSTWRTTGSAATSYTATQISAGSGTNLQNGKQYTFRVRAVNRGGTGAQSAFQPATPLGPPGVPTTLTAAPGDQQVVLGWNAAAANGSDIIRYEYSSDDGSTWRTTGGTTTSYTATHTSTSSPVNLQNGTLYTFRVRAVNGIGTGAQSAFQPATPLGPPGVTTTLTAAPGDQQVVLGWNPAAANGSEIIRYEYSSDDGSTWRTTGGTTTSYTATQTSASSPTNLQTGTLYTFRVRAVNGIGTGPASHNASATPNTVPAFSSNTVTREVYENVGAGANVGDPVTATDADHDTITYTLGGTDAASFAIDSTSGQITVGTGTTLDYQVKRSYEVTVTATDSLNAADSTTVTINVLDIREAGFLGRIDITVGRAGGDYGYVSGSYGTLIGEFPVALFGDDTARTVGGIYEDADGNWYFTYSGGMADDWNISQKELDEVVVEVTYEDGKDSRSFVLGGFIEERTGDYTLKFDPPLPSRDWDDKDGEEVAFEFRRLRSQTTATTVPRETEPEGERGSFVEFLTESTPGGAVTAQMLIVILVYLMFIRTAPPTPFGVMLSAGVLILSPWVPMIFGYGDVLAASIILVNVLLAAFTYKVFAARTQ